MSICKNNTRVYTLNGKQTVVLHNTKIVEHSPSSRSIVFTTQGFNTASTKARLNQAMNEWKLPITVYSDKGVWYAKNNRSGVTRTFAGNVCIMGY